MHEKMPLTCDNPFLSHITRYTEKTGLTTMMANTMFLGNLHKTDAAQMDDSLEGETADNIDAYVDISKIQG